MQLRYNFRAYPTPGQRVALAKAFGCARVVWNDGLRVRQEAHAAGLPYIPDAAPMRRVVTEAKRTPERAWLAEVSAVVLQQVVADLNTAYRNFFASVTGKRRGPKVAPPCFKSRKDHRQAVRFTRNARFKITPGGEPSLPKIGEVAVRWSRPLPAEPSSVTIVKDATGRYFASFVVEVDAEPLPEVDAEVGIDLGLAAFAVLSNGQVVDGPRFLRRAERRLRKAQRELSRKQKGSKNREKARLKVAKAHARVADARRDFHPQMSTRIIRENQAVYVEDLAGKGLARTRFAKSVHDAGWAAFLAMLEYKAARYGRHFARIGWFEPTSQVCSACGVLDGPEPLHVRQWACRRCGTVHDRDLNAAKNILAAGRAERLNACGAGVRPGLALALAVKQEPIEVPRERHGRNPRRSRRGGRQRDRRGTTYPDMPWEPTEAFHAYAAWGRPRAAGAAARDPVRRPDRPDADAGKRRRSVGGHPVRAVPDQPDSEPARTRVPRGR